MLENGLPKPHYCKEALMQIFTWKLFFKQHFILAEGSLICCRKVTSVPSTVGCICTSILDWLKSMLFKYLSQLCHLPMLSICCREVSQHTSLFPEGSALRGRCGSCHLSWSSNVLVVIQSTLRGPASLHATHQAHSMTIL